MRPGYLDGLEEAGAVPVVLPLTDDVDLLNQLAERLDGIVFTGGQDVNPRYYDKPGVPAYEDDPNNLSPERDHMELALFRAAVRLDKPVLAICRGTQLMNVALGGTLWHDLPTEHPSPVDHWSKEHSERFKHLVTVVPGSPLDGLVNRLASGSAQPRDDQDIEYEQVRHRMSELAKTSQLHGAYQYMYTPQIDPCAHRNEEGAWVVGVNSYHHQAIRDVAPSLKVMAVSEDGVIEGVWRPASRFMWGVQWHPELLHRVDARSRAIFSTFVEAAEG